MTVILRIALPTPLHRLFDYLPPAGKMLTPLLPGCRIRVPFGNREMIGLLIETATESDVPAGKLKPALEVLDQTPVLDESLFGLVRWAAGYYFYPEGDALMQALPTLLRKGQPAQFAHAILWRATPTASLESLSGGAHRQRELLEILLRNPAGISPEALRAEDAPTQLLKTLAEKGLAEAFEHHPKLPHSERRESLLREPHLPLNREQQQAFDRIRQADGFEIFLLDGVTGSGKTEVYLQAIEQVLTKGQQALVLVPEIGLTPQTVARFKSRFNVPVLTLHSGLTERQRLDAWLLARDGSAGIMIGTRSAIFTPMCKPGLIIIDEEHDTSLKQQDGFRYSARDLAAIRCQREKIPLLLGSATPALESLHNALTGRYQHLQLTNRAGEAQQPSFELLDIRAQELQSGLSETLIQRIQDHLQQQKQVLLFLNRRGFSPSLICHQCGTVIDCTRCDARMTLHRYPPHMHCHHCDRQTPIPRRCGTCGSEDLRPNGSGTERIEEVLNKLFPKTQVLRIDRDSMQRKNALENVMREIHKGEPCILVGTQMLAKGHHFPKVTLVAILDADSGLFSADFRGMEKTSQLILQVAGRAGRAESPGQVILQTHHADHPMLHALIAQGYGAFAAGELRLREGAALPPFSYHALIRAEATHQGLAEQFLRDIRLMIEQERLPTHTHCSGPFPAPLEKKGGLFRAQLLLQGQQRRPLHQLLARTLLALEQHRDTRKVRWSLDIDPSDGY